MRSKWREEKGLHKNEIQQEKGKTLFNKNICLSVGLLNKPTETCDGKNEEWRDIRNCNNSPGLSQWEFYTILQVHFCLRLRGRYN